MTINSLRKQKLPAIVLVLALLVGSFSSATPVFAIDAPVITTAPFTSSTTPITLEGTASSSATITVTGGADTETTTADGSGNWSVLVDLNLNAANMLEVTASDGVDTSATSTITIVHDDTAPIFDATPDVNATTTSAGGGTVDFTVTATDNLAASVTISCTPASGTNFDVGTTTVECTAEDDAGNTASTTFDVIMTLVDAGPDVVPPVFATTTDIMATATTSAGVVVDFVITATDDVDGPVSVVCTPASGSVFAIGSTTVTCTAMDNASNTATTTFDVIVNLAATTSPIIITHPIFASGLFCATSTPVLLEGTTAASSTITVVGGLNNATTTSDGSGAWSTMINLASNSTSTVFVTITDSSSNVIGTTTLNFAFDTTDPTITLNGDANRSITQGSTFTDPGVTVSDNLDANVSTSTSGTVNVNVAGTYTITYTATDCAGNTASVERTVTVNPTSSGGGSASGRRNATNNATGSVLGGTVEGTTFVSPLNPFQQVLGASAFIPGLPNTGAGGNASTNLALLLSSLGLAGLGTMVLRKRSQKTR